jgi:large repetitive protein
MSQPVVDPSPPGRRASARRFPVIRRTTAIAVAMLVVGALVAPSAALAANLSPSPGIDYLSGTEDAQLTGDVLANDTDPDGGTLTVVSYTPPTHGAMVVTAAGALTFTPPANYFGHQVTSYSVSDGQGGLSLGYIDLTVTPINDAPVAHADSADGTEDTDLHVSASALLANDTDVDGDTLSFTDVSGASGGTLSMGPGTVTFIPDKNLCGAAGFMYAISDGHGETASASVALTVTCVNDAPVAHPDTATVAQNSSPTTIDVTANDVDVEGDGLTVTDVSVSATAGSVSIAGPSSVRFTPADLVEGEATVSYSISDGHGGTDSSTLTVTVAEDAVAPVPAVPVVHLGSGRVNEKVPVAISWSATDAGVGVASYEAQVSVAGGPWTALSTGSRTSTSRFVPFRSSIRVQVRATDRVGNVSDWIATSRTAMDYQAPGSSSVTYHGTWTTSMSASASGTGYRSATYRGASATLSFTAREVEYVATKGSAGGYVKVYVDGVSVGRYNLRSSSAYGQIIFRKAWPTSGPHTIRIVNDEAGRRASLDAFVVLR